MASIAFTYIKVALGKVLDDVLGPECILKVAHEVLVEELGHLGVTQLQTIDRHASVEGSNLLCVRRQLYLLTIVPV